MTFEIEDKAKGSQKELIVSSTVTWFDFQQQAAEMLNIFPANLQLQYRLSNTGAKSLPFDLNSHVTFGSLCNKLWLWIVPETLNNGKKSTHRMKLVTVKLFNRDTGGGVVHSSGKNSKVKVS